MQTFLTIRLVNVTSFSASDSSKFTPYIVEDFNITPVLRRVPIGAHGQIRPLAITLLGSGPNCLRQVQAVETAR